MGCDGYLNILLDVCFFEQTQSSLLWNYPTLFFAGLDFGLVEYERNPNESFHVPSSKKTGARSNLLCSHVSRADVLHAHARLLDKKTSYHWMSFINQMFFPSAAMTLWSLLCFASFDPFSFSYLRM